MGLALKIATRFLKSSIGQTILIAIGIGIGISVQIFIGSLIEGLQESLINKTVGNSSQITITSNNSANLIENYTEVKNNIINLDDRIINLTSTADGYSLIKKDDINYSVLIRGMNVDESNGIYNIKDKLIEGNLTKNDYEALIGKNLKEELNIKIGDTIKLNSNSQESNNLKVVGIFDLGVSSLNKSWIITNLKTSQNIFNYDDKVTGIEMQLEDVFAADLIANKLKENLNTNLKISNWKEDNAQLLSGLSGQSASSIMIQVFVLISVVLGIASVLAITVLQKSKQIAILKAMGLKDKDASLIFLFEGLILGLIGAFFGIALGLTLTFLFTKFALNPDGTPIIDLVINYKFIIFSAIIAIVSSCTASLIPARKTSKLDLLEVIKNG